MRPAGLTTVVVGRIMAVFSSSGHCLAYAFVSFAMDRHGDADSTITEAWLIDGTPIDIDPALVPEELVA